MGPAQPGQRVQQDDDVLTGLHQALGPLHDQLGEGDVLLGRPVEGGGVHLAAHRAAHLGDLLGALVQQQDHQPALGVVAGHGCRELLEQHGLAALRRGHDQPALALADRCEEIRDPAGRSGRGVFEADAVVRVERGEVAEVASAAEVRRFAAVDAGDLGQGALGAPDALDEVALAQPVAPDQGRRDLRVGGGGEEARGPQMPLPVRVDVENTGDERGGRGLLDHGRVFESGGHGGSPFTDGRRQTGRGGEAASGRRGQPPPGGGNGTSGTARTPWSRGAAEKKPGPVGSLGRRAGGERTASVSVRRDTHMR